MKKALTALCFASMGTLLFGLEKPAAPAPVGPAITKVDIRPSKIEFSRWNTPVELTSLEDAKKHFEGDPLDQLKAKVDFGNQIVLVFAWRGSGQDKLDYVVMKSFPEQIAFSYRPGRTKDLRPHVQVFALRSNVKWRAGGK
jgi:hypothetical protein